MNQSVDIPLEKLGMQRTWMLGLIGSLMMDQAVVAQLTTIMQNTRYVYEGHLVTNKYGSRFSNKLR
jgi:hypothetical protein